MTIAEIIPVYLGYCQEQRRLDPKTVKAYRIDLGQLSESIGPIDAPDVGQEDLEDVFAAWHASWKPKSVKRKIASVKAFFRWMEEKGHIADDPFRKMHVRFREPKVLPRTIPDHNLRKFLQALYDARDEGSEYQRRNALRDIAAIELLFATGMRISELCALAPGDVDLTEGFVLIHGKGKKERMVQIPDEALLELLRTYRKAHEDAILRNGRFFVNSRRNPISDQSVRQMIEKYGKLAGIEQHITPHMFRHTFATSLMESDVNLRYIQQILGHSSVKTTEIYTHVSAAKQRQILAEKNPRGRIRIDTRKERNDDHET